jgi:SET domain
MPANPAFSQQSYRRRRGRRQFSSNSPHAQHVIRAIASQETPQASRAISQISGCSHTTVCNVSRRLRRKVSAARKRASKETDNMEDAKTQQQQQAMVASGERSKRQGIPQVNYDEEAIPPGMELSCDACNSSSKGGRCCKHTPTKAQLPEFVEVKEVSTLVGKKAKGGEPILSKGLFAKQDIKQGVRLCQYSGKRFEKREDACPLYTIQMEDKLKKTFYLQADANCMARYANCSHHPPHINIKLLPTRSRFKKKTRDRYGEAWLVTVQAIAAGTELLWDYGPGYEFRPCYCHAHEYGEQDYIPESASDESD